MKRLVIAGLLLAGAIVRVAALPLPGSPDVGSWKVWTFAGSTDPAGLYGVGGTPPERRLLKWRGTEGTTEYPPLALYEMSAMGRLYWRIDPLYRDSPTLTALVKTPGLLAELMCVGILLTWGRRRFGDGVAWAAVAYWINPAVILNGAVLGYLDAQMAVPAALALLAAAAGASGAAGALAACALLTKAQTLFVLPAIALVVWGSTRASGNASRWRALIRALVWGALTAAIVLLPVIARGGWANMLQAIGRLAAHNQVSAYALNVWWILTWIVRASAADLGWWSALTIPVRILQITDWMRLLPNPKPFGTTLVGLAILWACWRARRGVSLAAGALLGGWCVYAYTMLGVQVHENHLYLAVPFLLIAAGLDPALRALAWAVTLVAAVNMYVFYGLGDGWPPLVDRRWTVVDLTVWLSAVNVGLFVLATRRLARALRTPRH